MVIFSDEIISQFFSDLRFMFFGSGKKTDKCLISGFYVHKMLPIR